MFIDIWDKENKAIKINEFGTDLGLSCENRYRYTYYKLLDKYKKLRLNRYELIFSSTEGGFNEILDFALIADCFAFLMSGTFQYLFESEDIDFIKIITANKQIMFKYDAR